MAVSEQTDSLRVLGSDPVNYLISPRIVACMVATPILCLLCFCMGTPPPPHLKKESLCVIVCVGGEGGSHWGEPKNFCWCSDAFRPGERSQGGRLSRRQKLSVQDGGDGKHMHRRHGLQHDAGRPGVRRACQCHPGVRAEGGHRLGSHHFHDQVLGVRHHHLCGATPPFRSPIPQAAASQSRTLKLGIPHRSVGAHSIARFCQ